MTWTQIDTGGDIVRAVTPGSRSAPFERAGQIWGVFERYNIGTGITDQLRVYASADDGATWAEQDSANRPVGQSGAVYYAGGSTIYVAFYHNESGTRTIRLTSFNMDTALWGAVIMGGPGSISDYRGLSMVRRSDGSFVVAYSKSNQARYATYSGGAWSGETQFDPGGGRRYMVNEILLDAADLVHFFFAGYLPFGDLIWHVYHRSLDSVGALGTAQELYTLPATNNYPFQFGPPSIWQNKIVLPYGNSSHYPAVAIGTPSGAADPAWSFTQISAEGLLYDLTLNHPDNNPLDSLVDGTTLYVFWVSQDSTRTGDGSIKLSYAVDTGTGFGAPVVLDTATPVVQDFYHNPHSVMLASGALGTLVDRVNSGGDSLSGWLLVSPPPAPILTIVKILVPSSDPGLFDLILDATIEATNVGDGGTTGPITTTAGHHIVAESGGTGTSLADYTVRITGDAAADGQIDLLNGDNKTVTITNTRNGPPSPSALAIDCAPMLAVHAGDVFDLVADFSAWLESGDALASAVWSADWGIGITPGAVSATAATARISLALATAGSDVWVRIMADTEIGLREIRSIRLAVRSCISGQDEPGPHPMSKRLPVS